jgi:hypothetical protein
VGVITDVGIGGKGSVGHAVKVAVAGVVRTGVLVRVGVAVFVSVGIGITFGAHATSRKINKIVTIFVDFDIYSSPHFLLHDHS